MSGFRDRIETWFEQFAGILFDNKFKVFCLIMIIFIALVSQLPKITLDTSTEGFLRDDDPILLDYEAFRDQFGRDEMAIVALEPEKVFDIEFLKKLKALHEDLAANLPYLDDITSLINARNTYGSGDELIVEDLLEEFPTSQAELKAIEKRAKENRLYKNLLLSEDGKLTTIVLKTHTYSGQTTAASDDLSGFAEEEESEIQTSKAEYLTDEENSVFVRALEKIVAKHRAKDIKIHIAGTPVVSDFLKRSMMENMRKFMIIAFLTISVFLLLMFRRLSGLFMPILIVAVSLISTIGLMAICGTPIKLPTQILPSFLLSVAVGASVHVLVIFFRKFDQKGDKRRAIAYALGHSGLAIVMTSLTTAGGLLSFSTAEVAPIADLGIFAAAGVLFSLIYTITLLPALLAILPVKSKVQISQISELSRISQTSETANTQKEKKKAMDLILDTCITLSTQYPKSILAIAGLMVIVALMRVPTIELSHDPLRWFSADNSIRQSTELLDVKLKGTISLEVVLDSKAENGLYEPALLKQLEASSQEMEQYRDEELLVGKALSLTTVLKETNQALHENKADFYSIPDNKNLIAQEFFLFENSGSDDLEDFTDTQFSKARFTLKTSFIDAIGYSKFMNTVEEHFRSGYPDQEITITGMIAMLAKVLTASIHSMLKSYGYALFIITFLMILLIGRIKIGLVSMIPNIFPIIMMLGLMGWAGLPMDLFCMMVGSIAIGLAVDDTIHFMHNFRRYFEGFGDAKKAIHETLHTTGRAMLVTTCVLSIGFFTFMFSEMNNLFNFGLLTGFTLFIALLADYFIAPALMVLLNKKESK